jgi:hypothetical protein
MGIQPRPLAFQVGGTEVSVRQMEWVFLNLADMSHPGWDDRLKRRDLLARWRELIVRRLNLYSWRRYPLEGWLHVGNVLSSRDELVPGPRGASRISMLNGA